MTTFQTEDFSTITAGMINHARSTQSKVTDFTPGSKARTLLEAAASQVDEFYQQLLSGILAAIPVATFQSFNFPAIAAQPASGLVNVTISALASNLTIPAGTVCQPNGVAQTFQTIAPVTIAAGSTTGTVSVTATSAGAAGNLAANQVWTFSPTLLGFITAVNPAAFVSGQDAETTQAQQVRFAAYINSLQRCTVSGIQYGLSLVNLTDASHNITEKVVFSYVNDPIPSPGSPPQAFAVYIHNGVGQTSAQLVAAAQQTVNGYVNAQGVKVAGYKAAGIPCTVYAATDLVVTIGGTLTALPGYVRANLVAPVNAALGNYMRGLPPGSGFVLAQAYAAVMAVPGVYDWVPAALAVNASATAMGDVAAAATQKVVPGVNSIS